MFETLGRIVSRRSGRHKIAGLFLPMGKGLPAGIYEVRSVMGELTIVRIGKPAMPKARLNGLDLMGLHAEACLAAMTCEELRKTERKKP